MPILCGSDLSPGSADALAAAIALAERRGDKELILVHIAEAGDQAPVLNDAQKTLSEQSDEFVARVPVRIEVRAGATAETLADLAIAEGADLIVVGAGPRAAGRLGSFAGHLVEVTAVPVLLVRDPGPWVEFGRGERAIKILAGVDDSATGDVALHWLKAMRQIGPVDVTLGAVYYPDEACHKYGLKLQSHVERDPEVEELLTRDLLHRFEPAVGAGEVEARMRLGLGRIGDHLIELAQDTGVDAIVVGTRQRTGLGKLGSVSSVVVANAPQSVICIPPEAQVPIQTTPRIRRVLVATDLTPFANRAVPYAFSIAQGGEVHLLHVMSHEDDTSPQELHARLLAMRPTGVATALHAHVERSDDTAERIGQISSRLGVDIICIASHNRSGLGRALLGSVADRLLRETRIPVLILRPAP
ncbi:MAG TPA: universal stress protein [Kofleriaceae bacterium]|nr:universal stress protein [Kofleriaceae bacterium]